jgi:hypothetical protein
MALLLLQAASSVSALRQAQYPLNQRTLFNKQAFG